MDILRWTEAARRGLTRYYTGRPCREGHDSERFVTTMACVDCTRVKRGLPPEAKHMTRGQTAAHAAGRETFRTNVGCPHGHAALRITATGRCYYCERIAQKETGPCGRFRSKLR